MNVQQEAERIYKQVHPTEKQVAFIGEENLRPIQRATVNEIAVHIQNCEDAAKAAGLVYLDYQKIEFGTSRDEIFAIAASKKKSSNRHAGTRALINKYGKVGAEDIIARKTGKRVNLKG